MAMGAVGFDCIQGEGLNGEETGREIDGRSENVGLNAP
jgi:hypothetical protein